jgi:hypothetical protein
MRKKTNQLIALLYVTIGVLCLATLTLVVVLVIALITPSQNVTNRDSADTKTITLELSSDTLKITEPGTYRISGTTNGNGIEVTSSGLVNLVLDNVRIVNNYGPAIAFTSMGNYNITLQDGSDNYLANGLFDTEGLGSVIYSNANLTISGNGRFHLNARIGEGITAKGFLTIRSSVTVIVNGSLPYSIVD